MQKAGKKGRDAAELELAGSKRDAGECDTDVWPAKNTNAIVAIAVMISPTLTRTRDPGAVVGALSPDCCNLW